MTQAFLDAVKAGDTAAEEDFLRRDGSLANARTPAGTHVAVLALYYGKPDVSRIILAHKPTLDLPSAAAVGDLARVRELVAADPRAVNALAPDGNAALGLAAYLGHRPVVEFLLREGADVNFATPKDRFTALTGAISSGHADVVGLLLAEGADANHRYEGGNTPLTEAASNGDPRVVRALLDHGADPQGRNDEGKTALDLALARGHREVADLLRSRGAPE